MKLFLKISDRLNILLNEKNINEIIKGSAATLVLRITGFFLSFILTMIVAKYYGADALGILAIMVSLLSIAAVLSLFGFRTATVRQIARYAKHGRSVLLLIYKKTGYLVIVLSLLIGTILYLNSAWIALRIFQKEELTLVIKLVAIVLPFRSINAVNTASLTGLKKITESFSLQLFFPPLLNLILLIILINVSSNNYLVPVYANGITIIISIPLTFYFWYHSLRKIPVTISTDILESYEQEFSYKGLLALSLPMFFSASMLLIMGAIDTLFLGIFDTTQNTGIYRVALKLTIPISFVLTSINSISSPKFAELYHHKKFDELKRSARFASKLSFLFSLPVVLLLLIVVIPILSYLGPSFRAGFMPFIILIVGRLVSSYFGPNGPFLNMTDNHKVLGKTLALAAGLNILLNYLLIPPFGIIGAAIATSFSVIILNVLISFVIFKKFGYWINYLPNFRFRSVS